MIQAVFFDVANTLLDKPDLYHNIEQVLARHGHTVDREQLAERHRLLSEVMAFPDKTSKDFYLNFNTELLRMLGIVPDEDLVTEVFTACTYLPWQAFEDVDSIKDIALPKGVISNWDISLREKLGQFVNTTFDWVLGSEEMKVRKPSLEFYRNILLYTHLKADEVLYIGDSIKLDVQPALLLGIKAVLIDRLDLYPNASVNRIRHMSELQQYL